MTRDAWEIQEIELGGGVVLRPLAPDDAEALADAYVRNRDHLRPWEPRRAPEFFTATGQVARVSDTLKSRDERRTFPWVFADGPLIVGILNLNDIVLGPFRNAHLGYWIDAGYTGRGLVSGAVRAVCSVAAESLGLHRVQAATILDNEPSQRVLRSCGFQEIGVARAYLHIDGEWRDHLLWEKILHDGPPR
ncbi:GNAT family N-acetyltransferase [Nonomuraea sp. NPDC048826]|uniref:GNAT family N-acetyltransferase n=1 Tax=Nonomuraea sp. NPDC048826 TaxID=3364347 RepID=UPI00371DD68C